MADDIINSRTGEDVSKSEDEEITKEEQELRRSLIEEFRRLKKANGNLTPSLNSKRIAGNAEIMRKIAATWFELTYHL